MDLLKWLYDGSDAVIPVIVSVVGIFFILGVSTRFGRLRSLSQMTGFDFGVNVAIGSIIASTVLSPDPSLFRAAVALLTIFAMQLIYSTLRRHLPVSNPSSQSPHVLWAQGSFIEDHMRATKFTREDVHYAMRLAKVPNFDTVWFIAAEPTGSVVVWTDSDRGRVSRDVFHSMRGWELIPGEVG